MRKIIVNNILFRWSFSGKWNQTYISSLFFKLEKDNTDYLLRFKTADTFTAGNPLNEGLPLMKDGSLHSINLNQPGYVSEIIQFVLVNKIGSEKKKHYSFDGNKLLLEMGYEDVENYFR